MAHPSARALPKSPAAAMPSPKASRHSAPAHSSWAPRVADAAPSGDLAFTSGDAIIHIGKDTSYSNYLTVWKRLADGKWRFVADGGNSAPAPTPAH